MPPGLLKDIVSKLLNPENELKVNVKPPNVQLKPAVKDPSDGDPLGQAAALAGAAPAKAKVPAAAKRAAPSLKRLFMI